METENKGEYLCRKLCSVVCMCVLLCVRERERERVVCVCVLRYKIKCVFFTVGHNQPVLKVPDVEHTNGAKQRAIANGFPGEREMQSCVAGRGGFPEDVWE